MAGQIYVWVLVLAALVPPSLLASPPKPAPVYTAEKAREVPQSRPTTSAAPSPQPTVGTSLEELYDEAVGRASPAVNDVPDNKGFVDPIDFGSFLSDVGFAKSKKPSNSPLFSSSNNQDTFSDFFKSNSRNADPFSGQSFGGISSSASNQNSKKADGPETDDVGFVDPDVQFRSLFDSAETADGFRPHDFLGAKGNNEGSEPSRGSQTRSYPSYTYTGRNDDEEEHDEGGAPEGNRYRSSYRQVNGRGDRDNDRQAASSRGPPPKEYDPYDDNNYYGGEYDDSPAAPQNPKYKNARQPTVINNRFSQRQGEPQEETKDEEASAPAHNAQASGPKPAESTSGGKQKCKKVEKQVDYDEDYSSFVEPEGDYDPASYDSRYKRQASGGRRSGSGQNRGGSSKKRPMTCYVCEDEQGRYAERCSYDSKQDPKQGSFFHSESTSFNDNGRGKPSGRSGSAKQQDRYRRHPGKSASITAASTKVTKSAKPDSKNNSNEREKRQSGRGNQRPRQQRPQVDDGLDEEDRDQDDREYGNGNGGGSNSNSNSSPEDYDSDYDSGYQRRPSGNTPRGSSTRDTGFGNGHERNRNDYGFGAPRRQNQRPDFDFGPPADFGRDEGATASGSNNRDQGFDRDFNFNIPRDFDPDVQVGTSNTNNRPVYRGSASSNSGSSEEFGPGFDHGYEDYVKQYFPAAFVEHAPGSNSGSGSGSSSGSGSRPRPSPPRTPTQAGSHPAGRSSSSSSSVYPRGHAPNQDHTQHSNQYAPPPYYGGQDNGNGGGGGGSGGGIDRLVGEFNVKDRSGCQKVVKGEMTCYVCRDARGMNKEECMYSSNDPQGKNTRMSYHESTEYSSPSITTVPRPKRLPIPANQKLAESKVVNATQKSVDYDFDY